MAALRVEVDGEQLPRLDSMTKEEWRVVVRVLAPWMTDEQFDTAWARDLELRRMMDGWSGRLS